MLPLLAPHPFLLDSQSAPSSATGLRCTARNQLTTFFMAPFESVPTLPLLALLLLLLETKLLIQVFNAVTNTATPLPRVFDAPLQFTGAGELMKPTWPQMKQASIDGPTHLLLAPQLIKHAS